ncbi:MAG TPA: endonuclease, partial [Sphingomicrobium sp.]|nr:endonuclease [Sphingomicrobium sp.]
MLRYVSGAILLTLAASASAQPIKRVGADTSPISASVEVPSGSRLVYVSGTVPDAVKPDAPAGSIDRFGDTEAQTRSILAK